MFQTIDPLLGVPFVLCSHLFHLAIVTEPKKIKHSAETDR